MHRGCEDFGLKEAVDKILNRKKEIEETNRELERRKEEMNKKREEYYEKHMKEETE